MTKKYEGPVVVGSKTLRLVRLTLRRERRGMTVKELSTALGKSQPTIRMALRQLEAVENRTAWPRLWRLPDDDEAGVDVIDQLGDGDDTVLVPIITGESNWVSRWNDARERLAKGVAKLEIDAERDPEKLFDEFLALARSAASVAYALKEAKQYPDWYFKLGGQIKEEMFDDAG